MPRQRQKKISSILALPKATINQINTKIVASDAVKSRCLIVSFLIFQRSLSGELGELSSQMLKDKVGTNYKSIISMLLDANVIVTDNHFICSYSANEFKEISESKCKSYALTADLSNIESFVIHYKKAIGWHGKKGCFGEDRGVKKSTRKQNVIDYSLRCLPKFKIDAAKAIEYMCKRQRGLIKDKEPMDAVSARVAIGSVLSFANGYYRSSISGYGRLDTNFTNMSSWIRENCVYMDSEELVQLDVVSSQPNILRALMMSKDIPKKEMDLFTDFCKTDLYKCLYLVDFSHRNINKFKRIESQKVFEAHFKDELDNSSLRCKYKNEIIIMLFDKSTTGNIKGFKRLYKTFKVVFPTIYGVIKSKKKLSGYESVAHELQRLESKILHKVILKLKSNEIDFYSVHDSIVIPSKHLNKAKEIFELALNESDVIPNLEIKKLTSNQLAVTYDDNQIISA